MPGGLLLHRLVSFDEDGRLVTRGDANRSDDSVHADPSDVRGLAVLRVPWVGLPAVWRAEGRYGAIAVTAVLLVAGAVFASRGWVRRAEPDEDVEPEQLDVDPDALTIRYLPPVRDDVPLRHVEPAQAAPAVRRLPPVPAPARAPDGPVARELPAVPAARPRPATTTVAAPLPVHPASSSSAAVHLSKTETVRSADVRSFARPAGIEGGKAHRGPRSRSSVPPVPPAAGRRDDDRVAGARPAGPRVGPAGDHGPRADGGSFRGEPRR